MSDTFGERLRTLRKKAGLTQEELAHNTGYSIMSIRRWEWGERTPRLEEIKALAKALGVPDADLLNEQPPPTQRGWVLHLRVIDDTPKEVIDLNAPATVQSYVGTNDNGGYLVLGGDYSLWTDDAGFKQLVKKLKELRSAVIQYGKAHGSIKDN